MHTITHKYALHHINNVEIAVAHSCTQLLYPRIKCVCEHVEYTPPHSYTKLYISPFQNSNGVGCERQPTNDRNWSDAEAADICVTKFTLFCFPFHLLLWQAYMLEKKKLVVVGILITPPSIQTESLGSIPSVVCCNALYGSTGLKQSIKGR